MYYDYYYKVDGQFKRYTSTYELTSLEINNLFGSSKQIVLRLPITFERTIVIEDEKGVKTQKPESVIVGYLSYLE